MLGYMCAEHGYRDECDVSEAGERLCPDCGVAVTGLVGRTRSTSASPPTDVPNAAEGNIVWLVDVRGGDRFTVEAFDYLDAADAAEGRVDDPKQVEEIKPKKREYRH